MVGNGSRRPPGVIALSGIDFVSNCPRHRSESSLEEDGYFYCPRGHEWQLFCRRSDCDEPVYPLDDQVYCRGKHRQPIYEP